MTTCEYEDDVLVCQTRNSKDSEKTEVEQGLSFVEIHVLPMVNVLIFNLRDFSKYSIASYHGSL